MKQIHIVGTGPCTGTTLTAKVMIACFHIDHHTDHETRIFSPPPEEGDTYLTKVPHDLLVVQSMLRVDPDLYAIWIRQLGLDPSELQARLPV